MKRYVGAIDQGTTSTRFILFDTDGQVVAFDQMEHRQIYPQPGWVEHDPHEIFEKTLKVIIGAFSKSGIDPSEVAAIGITNQRETTVLWSRKTGRAFYNALVWQDVRTSDFCKKVEATHGTRIREKTGLPVATYFSASKIRWILDNVPEAQRAAKDGDLLFGTVDSWLIWRLTGGPKGGVHVTDATNASRTLLMDLKTLKWDKGLLEIFGLPESILPEIRPSSEVYGLTTVLPTPIPVASALGDQQAALFGQTCFEPGETKNTYGTGCFLLMNTGKTPIRSSNGLLTTVACLLPNEEPVYGLEGSVAMGGATVQWLRDNLAMISKSSEVENLARTVPDNGGMYFVPAFSGLFAPYWRSDARGTVVGMTRYIEKGHFARAVLESVAYQTRDVLAAMEKDSGIAIKELRVDGGMTANELLVQFQSDILGADVIRPVVAETTALGAAYAAGLAVGVWKNRAELKTHWKIDKRWSPQMPDGQKEGLYRQWKRAIEKSLGWVEEGDKL